jgi:hypothetical protein
MQRLTKNILVIPTNNLQQALVTVLIHPQQLHTFNKILDIYLLNELQVNQYQDSHFDRSIKNDFIWQDLTEYFKSSSKNQINYEHVMSLIDLMEHFIYTEIFNALGQMLKITEYSLVIPDAIVLEVKNV